MRYPSKLQEGDTLGIVAPSFGVTGNYGLRLDNAIKQLKTLGYSLIELQSVRRMYKLTTGSPRQRAEEFMSMYQNREVKAIFAATGGELLVEMLPYLDYSLISELEPKWILGYSDISNLLFAITLKCDVATAHGPILLDFGGTPLNAYLRDSLEVLSSNREISQNSYQYYQPHGIHIKKDAFSPGEYSEEVEWKCLQGNKCISEGRLIGGCLDTLQNLVGTPYAPFEEFANQYADEGVLWFLESCDMDAAQIFRALWQMKESHWFDNCNGIVFGRPSGYSDVLDFTFIDALSRIFEESNISIIYNADIGHHPPQLTLINGSYVKIEVNQTGATVTQVLMK